MMDDIKQGDWVRVHRVVLAPEERAARLPEETRQVPLELWATGTLLDGSASIGDQVRIRTVTGRVVEGRLESHHPSYSHSFGAFVPELLAIRQELRGLMAEGERDGLES